MDVPSYSFHPPLPPMDHQAAPLPGSCNAVYPYVAPKRRTRPNDDDWSDIESPPPSLPPGRADQDDLTEAVHRGSRCESRELFWVRRKENPRLFRWVDEKPLDFAEVEKGKTKKVRETYAVNIHYKHNEQKDEWYPEGITINSPEIREALETILEGYPGLTQHELVYFTAPFLCFVHRWQDLLDYLEKPDLAETTVDHLRLLKAVLDSLLEESFEKVQAFNETGHVSFDDLQLIFTPATIVVQHSTQAAGVVRSCTVIKGVDTTYFQVQAGVVHWDGRRCGVVYEHWSIKQYRGLREMHALEVSPLKGLPEEADIRERLIQRGRRYEELRGQFFMAYTDEHAECLNERMVIDAQAYHKYELGVFPPMSSLEEIGRLTWAQSMNNVAAAQQNPFAPVPPNNFIPVMPPPPGAPLMPGQPDPDAFWEKDVKVDLTPLTDEQCLLALPTVRCFNIDKKIWEQLELVKFHAVPWAERAFDNLVLDQGEKDLVLALVDRDHFNKGKSFDDFITGKGQGMIMLLCGPPGVGKTLTGETVAEHLRRPLYRLGASDIGTNPRTVEAVLDKAFRLCAHFGAVLLIDEADVFMEARSINNIMRNELVSVFLRLLEYYKGIMILTTNRIRSMDAAFESRIDITLTYNPLNEASRQKVWSNFLVTLNNEQVNINEDDLASLAKWEFNGRQIKSAIKTARVLAAKKKEPLNVQHLEIVLKLRQKALKIMHVGSDLDHLPPPPFL